MQMIADGKLKEGTRIKNMKEDACFEYEDGDFFNKEHCLYLNHYFEYSLKGLVTDTFEILEDITEEIEEIDVKDNKIQATSTGNYAYSISQPMKIIINKINELVKAVNRLNKPIDTSKETNCMTD